MEKQVVTNGFIFIINLTTDKRYAGDNNTKKLCPQYNNLYFFRYVFKRPHVKFVPAKPASLPRISSEAGASFLVK